MAGMSEAGIYKARQAQHVQELYEELKGEYIQEVEALRAPHKARAFEVARQLMDGAKSEAVRMRAVEFLAGEGKGNAVNVQINNNISGDRGYEYARPDQEIVVIRGAGDTATPAHQVQDAEIIDD